MPRDPDPLASTWTGDDPQRVRVRAGSMARLFGDPLSELRLGRYRLGRELGRGAMGTVYAAQDPELGREVAVKVLDLGSLRLDLQSRSRAIRRLVREARAAARLSDPHVVEIYDVGIEDDVPYVVMELVAGGTLGAWLASGPHPIEAVIDALVQCARGLAAAHRVGILHRDFKPANVLRSRDGRLRIADFGLALPGAEATIDDVTHASDVNDASTMSNAAAVGTPAFMAPEQYLPGSLDGRADQFAFCVTAHLALHGVLPFRGATPTEVLAQKLVGHVDAPPCARVVRRVHGVIARGLAPDPARRWPDMDGLVAALLASTRPRWHRWLVVAAALVIVSALAVARPHSPPQEPRVLDSTVAYALVVSRLAAAVGNLELARSRGNEALWAATARGQDALAFDAAVHLARLEAMSRTDLEAARRYLRTAEASFDRLAIDPRRDIALERARGVVEQAAADYERARRHGEAALALAQGVDDPLLRAMVELDLANTELLLGDAEAARARLDRVLPTVAAHYGDDHPEVADVLLVTAIATLRGPVPRESIPRAEQAAAIYRRALGPDDPHLANALTSLGHMAAVFRLHDRALEAWRESYEIHRRTVGEGHPRTLLSLGRYAEQLAAVGRVGEAEPLAVRAVEGLRTADESRADHLAHVLDVLGRIEHRIGRTSSGLARIEEAIAVELEHGDATVALEYAGHAAELQLALGHPARARDVIEPILPRADTSPSLRRARVELVLAQALLAAPARRDEAIRLASEARMVCAARGADARELDAIDAWLPRAR